MSLSALFVFFFGEKTLLSPLIVEKVLYSPILYRFLTGGKMAAWTKTPADLTAFFFFGSYFSISFLFYSFFFQEVNGRFLAVFGHSNKFVFRHLGRFRLELKVEFIFMFFFRLRYNHYLFFL